MKKLFLLGSLAAALVAGLYILVNYWRQIVTLVVSAKELLDNILKALLPKDPATEDDMSDYYDI